MSRPKRKRRSLWQIVVFLLLALRLAGILLRAKIRLNRQMQAAEPTAAPEVTAEPTPEPTPTPSPTTAPNPTPTPEPTPDGLYHTGDAELDQLLYAVIAEKTDESMSDEEKLHALYEYVSGSFGYLRRKYYEPGEHDWLNEEAKTMLTERNGNCYNFAATFCLLARCIGYDAEAYSGTIYGRAEPGQTRPPDRPHGRGRSEIDGHTSIFDPDMHAVGAFCDP